MNKYTAFHKRKVKPMHPSITIDRIEEAVESQMLDLENPGFCLACGEDAFDCEPDARHNTCEYCDESEVFGAEEVMLMVFP